MHKRPAALMKYLYRIKDCMTLKKKQIVRSVREHVNQKAMEEAALWVLSYVAKAYHFLRKKIEEHANDSMEGKDLSMRSWMGICKFLIFKTYIFLPNLRTKKLYYTIKFAM